MVYMVYTSTSLQHVSYCYCYAAAKGQKHKENQIYIRSDEAAALVFSSHGDLDPVLLLEAYWRGRGTVSDECQADFDGEGKQKHFQT